MKLMVITEEVEDMEIIKETIIQFIKKLEADRVIIPYIRHIENYQKAIIDSYEDFLIND